MGGVWNTLARLSALSRIVCAALAYCMLQPLLPSSPQNLLDYSLLVGIHRLPAELSAPQREDRLHQLRTLGGYVSLDRQKVGFSLRM